MKRLFALTLSLFLLMTACGGLNSSENSIDTAGVSITSTETKKSESTTSISTTATETSLQTVVTTNTMVSESKAETTTPKATAATIKTTAAAETTTEPPVPVFSAFTDKTSYKNDEIVKFTILLSSDTMLWLNPYNDFERLDGDKWTKLYTVKEGFGPGEVSIGISKGQSETFNLILSDYGELPDGKYRIGQQHIADEKTYKLYDGYAEFQIIS